MTNNTAGNIGNSISENSESSLCENSEIKTFKDFLDKINQLPTNPKYSAFNSSGASVPHQNSSTSVKANIAPPPAKPTHLNLTLKPLRGESQTIRVPLSQAIGDLRVKVSELFKITEVDRCRLIRGGKALSDDKQSVENVFGCVGDGQTLHVLEKPAVAAVASTTATGATVPSTSVDLKCANHAIWSKIDTLLQNEAGISVPSDRSSIIEKFRKSLQ